MDIRLTTGFRTSLRKTRLVPFLFLLCGAFFCAHDSSAQVKRWVQPDSVPPLVKMYNVGDEEFIVGVMLQKALTDSVNSIEVAWDFARWLNASDWLWTNGYGRGDDNTAQWEHNKQMDTLAMLALSGERFSTSSLPIEDVGGAGGSSGGQMLEVFPFDSVQSPYYRWEFLDVDMDKGRDTTNGFYTALSNQSDWPWRSYHTRERVYDDPGDAGLVAEHLALNYDAVADLGWAAHIAEENGNRANDFLQDVYSHRPTDQTLNISLALKGHMGPTLNGAVPNGDTIFTLKLVHVVPSGKYYRDDTGAIVLASSYTEIVIDSFAVTKGELITGTDNLAKYRDISFTTDLRYRFNDPSKSGPLHPLSPARGDTGSKIFDVKVYWSGKEKAALRSVMLRNEIAELMYGSSPASVAYRKRVLDTARRMMQGPGGTGPLREAILRLDSGHEPGPFALGSYRAVNRTLQDSLVYNGGADSVQAGMIEHMPYDQPQTNTIGARDVNHR
jgi:hypothetical protein